MRPIEERIELVSSVPNVNVQPAEYIRLLGFPHGWVLEGRARELADWARDWYARHGRPWVYARLAESLALNSDAIEIEGITFTSERLQSTFQQAEAHNVTLVAVGAGPEAEEEARRRWMEDKPDEYFFLEMYASAVVEHLTTTTGARLCAWAEQHGMAVLPHYSPGYPEWDITQQRHLLELVTEHGMHDLPSQVEVLDSGMLRPKKTLLAVFGLTQHTDRLARLTELVPCENCSYAPCQYRRAPYRRAQSHNGASRVDILDMDVLNSDAEYSVNTKALKRWAEERLSLQTREDGGIEAEFRYDGTTCTNMGRPLTFQYRVKLGPREAGYPIEEQHCAPATGDTGHTFMCQYREDPEGLMSSIDNERPLAGKPLNSVLAWDRPAQASGCYCDAAGREHKWGLVLETIHYALVQKERTKDTERS